MGKTQLSLTFTHIRTYWKIVAIINYFVTMKVFIILCIVIGISAGFSVVPSAEREAAVQGAEHDLDRQKRDLAGDEDEDAIAEVDGVNRFKREAKESKKKAEKGAGAGDVIHMGNFAGGWGR